jgi:hypothetical protein
MGECLYSIDFFLSYMLLDVAILDGGLVAHFWRQEPFGILACGLNDVICDRHGIRVECRFVRFKQLQRETMSDKMFWQQALVLQSHHPDHYQ